MTDTEIEAYRLRLNKLTAELRDEQKEKIIQPQLKKLAREVGASTCVFYIGELNYGGNAKTGEADSSELIRNIHQALQTASMVNMCSAATKGYEIATNASRLASIQFWIAAVIAFISAVAAWVAALGNR
jgi:hypothetical protein